MTGTYVQKEPPKEHASDTCRTRERKLCLRHKIIKTVYVWEHGRYTNGYIQLVPQNWASQSLFRGTVFELYDMGYPI